MNSHNGSIDPNEATRLLKDILRVGKAHPAPVSDNVAKADNPSMDGSTSSHVEAFASAKGENLLDSLFHNAQKDQVHSIHLSDNEEDLSVDICGNEVQVVVSPLHENASSSSRVKIKNIVDYGWELKYNLGRHVCLHVSGTYLAYAIRAATSPSGAVRVLNHRTGERTLVKGLRGLVRDMAFACIPLRVLLAITDEYGTLYVYEIQDDAGSLVPTLVLQVKRPADEVSSEYRRVVWCPFVPDDSYRGVDVEEDASKLLVVTNLDEAEVWNVGMVVREHGCGTVTPDMVQVGLQRILEHTKPVIDASFSPDGTALATADANGEVRFFQVQYHEPDIQPRCLHRWSPHGERPLSCVYFLDNFKTCNPDTQFWKYALTGADNNTELKLWSCETWACLQTIRFVAPPEDNGPSPALKVEIDPTASYMVLSDINRKMVYVGELQHSQQSTQARLVSLAQFPVTVPVLSFTVAEAARCRFKPSTDTEHVDRIDADPPEAEREEETRGSEKRHEGTLVRLFWMNTKSLQACHIVYPTTATSGSLPLETSTQALSQNPLVSGYTDHLSDLSLDAEELENLRRTLFPDDAAAVTGKVDVKDPGSSPDFSGGDVLLTPSDFTSPSHATILAITASPSAGIGSGRSTSTPTPCDTAGSFPSVRAALSSLWVATSEALDLSLKSATESGDADSAVAAAVLGPAGEEQACELSGPPPRKLSQRSTASSSSQEVADILAPSERLANASRSTEEEEELNLGLEYDSAQEELMPPEKEPSVEAAIPLPMASPQPPSRVRSISFENTEEREDDEEDDDEEEEEESEQNHEREPLTADENRLWPQLPGSSEAYEAVTAGLQSLRESHPPLPDNFPPLGASVPCHSLSEERESALSRLGLLASQQLKELTLLSESLDSLGSQLQEQKTQLQVLAQQRPDEERLLNSVLSESNANRAALARLEAAVTKLAENQRSWTEQQTTACAKSLGTMLGNRLDRSVSNVFKDTIVPLVTKTMELLRCDVSQRVSATEGIIRDSVAKLVKSKALADLVSQATSNAVQVHVQATCREVLQNTLVPTVDRICQNLFIQLNGTFQQGTRDFLHQVELHMDKQSGERAAEAMKCVQIGVERSLQASLRGLQEILTVPDMKGTMDAALKTAMQSFQTNLHKDLASQRGQLLEALKEEMRGALKETAAMAVAEGAAARSQVATPVPLADPQMLQQQISQLVRQGHYNTAFQQALSIGDLPTVVATCEMVKPSALFGQNLCLLQQPVLLSLIHQLCKDLDTDTGMKLGYLEEAVLSLDKDSPITKEHMKSILTLLCQKLNQFLTTQPLHQLVRNARRLLMVTQSVLTI